MRATHLLILLASLSATSYALYASEQKPIQSLDEPVHTTQGWSYVDCGLPSDPVQIQSIEVSPDPPKPGQDLTVTVNGKVLETLEEGAYADVVVKMGLIKLLQKQFDVCEEARNANASVQCPVQAGTYKVVHTVALPKEIPPAKFVIQVRGYTADDDDMVCLNLQVDFIKRPFPHLW